MSLDDKELESTTGYLNIGRPGTDGLWVSPVDEVALKARADSLCSRSIKTSSKLVALQISVACSDLTTLEGVDTPSKVRSLCQKAVRPDPKDNAIPSVAAVCVYPEMVSTAVDALKGSGVLTASVAGSFPSGLGPLEVRLLEIQKVVDYGADEIDIVLNRSAFLSGNYGQAFDEIAASKQMAGSTHLKVILETGELGSYDAIRRASMLAMAAGADFIKTSTGKIGTSATPPVALCMAEAIRDFYDQTGKKVGLKLAGGIKTSKSAWHYLVIIGETLGTEWCTPQLFRFGASTLLNDLLMQIARLKTGRYQRPENFTLA